MRLGKITVAPGARKSAALPRSSFKTSPLPGGGPWRILPECRSFIHNTLRSSRGKIHNCICPRALALKSASLERLRKANSAAAAARKANTGRGSAPTYMANIKREVDAPNLWGAPCTTQQGVLATDWMLSEDNAARARGITIHRRLCSICPVETFLACSAWVRTAETPAGAWGGMYAGKTRKERVRDAGA